MASAIGCVPASNFHGTSLVVKPSRRTSRIISPPPRNGGISSSSAWRPQRADAARTAHLVGGERDEVGVPRLHVGGDVRHVLARVDEHERVVGVGGVGERADVVDRAEHVRHRGDREQARAVEQLVEIGEIELVVGGHRDPAELDAALGREHVPRHDVGVVLHVREHDRVAGAQVGARPRVRDEVDGLGRVAHEHDLRLGAGADETGDLAARELVGGGGFLGDRVDAAVDVGVVVPVAVVHRVEHGERLLRRRRGVEVRDALAVDLALEQRKVALDRGDVERVHGPRRLPPRGTRRSPRPRRCASSASPFATIRPSMSTCTTSGCR